MAKWESVTSGLIAVAAIAVIGSVIRREFFAPQAAAAAGGGAGAPPVFVEDWESLRPLGTLIGKADAQATMVVFSDYECPFCARFHNAFVEAQKTLGDSLAMVFIHYPIGSHKFAKPGIYAAQCAEAQGRFAEMTEAIFSRQDSLGLKSWGAFARDAGIADTVAFVKCQGEGKFTERTDAGIAKAGEIAVRATPTVIVNGWRYSGFRSDSLLDIVRSRMPK